MKAVDLAGIRIEGNVSLQNIESVYIKTGLNRHGFCQIQAVVDENGYDGKPEMILKMENFKIIYETGQKSWFCLQVMSRSWMFLWKQDCTES